MSEPERLAAGMAPAVTGTYEEGLRAGLGQAAKLCDALGAVYSPDVMGSRRERRAAYFFAAYKIRAFADRLDL